MAKNNKFINKMRVLAELNKADAINKASDKIIPEIYEAVAIALHNECGFGYERINEIFVE